MRLLLVITTGWAAVSFGCMKVETTKVAGGLYVVSARGNGFTSEGDAMAEAYKRAAELCPMGFDVPHGTSGTTSAFINTNYGVQQIRKPETAIVVQCKVPEDREEAARPSPSRPPAPGVAGWWWCIIYPGGMGYCDRERAACEQRREIDSGIDPSVASSRCLLQGSVSCFRIAFVGIDGYDETCHPTIDACHAKLDYVRGIPEKARPLTECRPIDQ